MTGRGRAAGKPELILQPARRPAHPHATELRIRREAVDEFRATLLADRQPADPADHAGMVSGYIEQPLVVLHPRARLDDDGLRDARRLRLLEPVGRQHAAVARRPAASNARLG